jgi:hypothetical protein
MQSPSTQASLRSSPRREEAAPRTPPAPPAGVPLDVLECLLRDYLANRSAVITAYDSASFPHQGTNDSTSIFRVTFTWRLANSSLGSHTTTWIVKHWRAGGARDGTYGITQPREVLAWEQGWLRPAALPANLVVPFIGAVRSPDETEAWLAMADVSTELSAYPRMGLSGDQVISRAQTILARLAHFHAAWEQPERQAELQASPWLPRAEVYLWHLAPAYAQALGRPPIAHLPPTAGAPIEQDGLGADLAAFLDSRPADEQRLWERLLIDRHALVEQLAADPQTLLHNDLDDRNIGLRWPGDGALTESPALEPPDVVLIDWEWMAIGPAALDVAKIIQFLPVLHTPGAPMPAAFWTNELADYYFAHYRAAGGRSVDLTRWRRSYGMGLVARALAQMPLTHGRMLRTIHGELPPPQIAGLQEEVTRENLRAGLPFMEQMVRLVVREARLWLE